MPEETKKESFIQTFINRMKYTLAGIFFEQGCYPIETVLRRLQNSKVPMTTLTFMKNIHATHQYHELWQGFSLNLGYKMLTRPLKFVSQPYLEAYINDHLPIAANQSASRHVLSHTFAGGVTGFLEASIFYPWDTIKVRRQLGDQRHVSEMLQEPGLYNGLGTTIVRNMLGTGVLFLAYELTMQYVFHEPKEPTVMQTISASLVAAIISGIIPHPFDVLKTRLQAEAMAGVKVSGWSLFKRIIKEEGPGIFSNGVGNKVAQSLIKFGTPLVAAKLAHLSTNESKHEEISASSTKRI